MDHERNIGLAIGFGTCLHCNREDCIFKIFHFTGFFQCVKGKKKELVGGHMSHTYHYFLINLRGEFPISSGHCVRAIFSCNTTRTRSVQIKYIPNEFAILVQRRRQNQITSSV